MDAAAYIFVGRSGCGKGTQAALLKERVGTRGGLLLVETGALFREYITGNSHASELSRALYATGVRQPDFLACHMWTQILLDSYTLGTSVIFDGTPRSPAEAHVLLTALSFFRFAQVHVIHIDVSRSWSENHLRARGRADDATDELIERRLNWYDQDVVPALSVLEGFPAAKIHHINGEQAIQDVAAQIEQALSTA